MVGGKKVGIIEPWAQTRLYSWHIEMWLDRFGGGLDQIGHSSPAIIINLNSFTGCSTSFDQYCQRTNPNWFGVWKSAEFIAEFYQISWHTSAQQISPESRSVWKIWKFLFSGFRLSGIYQVLVTAETSVFISDIYIDPHIFSKQCFFIQPGTVTIKLGVNFILLHQVVHVRFFCHIE